MAKKKQAQRFMARQGDVLIMAADDRKPGAEIAREDGRVVLAHGEVTGHAHAIVDRACRLYMDEQRPVSTEDAATMIARLGGGLIPDRLLVCDQPVELKHEEHSTVVIPAGSYTIRLQREYTPRGLRAVAD